MIAGLARFVRVACCTAFFTVLPALVSAQELAPPGLGGDVPLGDLLLPEITPYAVPETEQPLARAAQARRLTLVGQLTEDGAEVTRGLVWRIFRTDPGADGKLPLVASAQGGTSALDLEPGSYLVHAAFGRAGATKKITVGREARREVLVLDAGGLKLGAELAGGKRIPPDKLRFSIYEAESGSGDDPILIAPDVEPGTVVRLNAGTYHVVSTYGTVNAVIRSDIRVEAGKLTEATVEHRAAEVTLKLVREEGGEAIADTSWSILSNSGDTVRESVGAYATMVLAEGDYAVVAKNRDRIYQRAFTVEGGHNGDVEVLANETMLQNGPEERLD